MLTTVAVVVATSAAALAAMKAVEMVYPGTDATHMAVQYGSFVAVAVIGGVVISYL